MVQLITLYYVVKVSYETALVYEARHSDNYFATDQSIEAALFTNLSFLTSDRSIFSTQTCNVDSLTVLQDTKILVSVIIGTIH